MLLKRLLSFVFLLLTVTLTTQQAICSDSSLDKEVRQLIRVTIGPENMENMYITVSNQMALTFQASIQLTIKRAITDSEKRRLQIFWYNALKDLMPYSALEDMLAPAISKYLTFEEVLKINQFYSTPVGKKMVKLMPVITREAESAGEELGRKLGDSEVMGKIMYKMKQQFPQWFPSDQ